MDHSQETAMALGAIMLYGRAHAQTHAPTPTWLYVAMLVGTVATFIFLMLPAADPRSKEDFKRA